MSLVAGSVTVASDATYTGTGLARALMDAHVATAEALAASQVAASGINTTPGSMAAIKVGIRLSLAAMANAYAAALVSYFQANATAHVTTEILGRMPAASPAPPSANLQPPSAPVDIPIT